MKHLIPSLSFVVLGALLAAACGSDSAHQPLSSPIAPTSRPDTSSIIAPPAPASVRAMSVGFDSGFAVQSVPFPPRNEPFAFSAGKRRRR